MRSKLDAVQGIAGASREASSQLLRGFARGVGDAARLVPRLRPRPPHHLRIHLPPPLEESRHAIQDGECHCTFSSMQYHCLIFYHLCSLSKMKFSRQIGYLSAEGGCMRPVKMELLI